MQKNNTAAAAGCGEGKGPLPSCAALAFPYIPIQPENSEKYDATTALSQGTLFPGLTLPFMNYVNKPGNITGELGELMALDFVINELGLYLDTHPDDKEALELYLQYVDLSKEAAARYTAAFGPITQEQVTSAGYTWLKNPWPWDYTERNGD